MKLELGNININDVQFGEETAVNGGLLTINKDEFIAAISDDPNILSVEVDIARPGESVRLIPCKDVIEPRVKVDGPGGIFPGVLADETIVGSGRTHVLKGVAVVTVGRVLGFQEGVLDMSGPGARYTPYSSTINVAVNPELTEGLEKHHHEEILRMMGLKAAVYLGEVGRDVEPDEIVTYDHKPLIDAVNEYPDLPRVGYVYLLQSQGLLHDTWVYGVDAKNILPTLISPTEVMDGALVSGNCVAASDKVSTFIHQNNPIIEDLYREHGKSVNFVGVIIANENVVLADKIRSSNYTAELAARMGWQGAIISEEGYGNPDTDLMMHCDKLEGKGIKLVIVTDEYPGRDGASQSFADVTDNADALVSVGNGNPLVTLPPMEKVIGHAESMNTIVGGFDGALKEDGTMITEIQGIMGATSGVGITRMSARAY